MITMQDFMETVGYRITEGTDYGWQCHGDHAYQLDWWNQQHDGHTVSIVFDTRTHTVYQASVCDYAHNRAYRRIHPDFLAAYQAEALHRDQAADQAWDEVDYCDLETDQDFLDKAQAIVQGRHYDTRVEVPIDLDDTVMLKLMTQAHEQDITFNQLVERIMRTELAQLQAVTHHQPSKKASRRALALELDGVITDLDQGGEFDAVCRATVTHVRDSLRRV